VIGSSVVSLSAPGYPERLARASRPPDHLYVRGRLKEADLAVAIVGARAARGHAMALARSMAQELAASGALIVSGGAIGVDSAAHRGALVAASGPTAAVLAGGLDTPYPGRNRPLFGEIVAHGGALVSMQPPGTAALRGMFVSRNRIIAGMVDAVVVVEAELGSGSLTTAEAARRLGRLVAAAPGSAGCEMLLARGAAVVESAADLLAALGGAPRRPTVNLPEVGSREALALAALDGAAPRSDTAIAAAAGLDLR
jgi:DNA processing protein